MKRFLWYVPLLFSAVPLLTSCNKDDDQTVDPVVDSEYRFVRILVNDELTNEVSLVDPVKWSVEKFQATHAKSALYGTQAGRYGALVNGTNNSVQFFDTGLEGHGDHVDVKGTPKFGALTGSGNKPTHFKSKGEEIIVFNDGDGTMSVAAETEIHTTGAKMTTIQTGNLAHHGAMAKFDNGTYAVTQKDNSVTGTLPERVRVLDKTGKVVFESTIQTKGIHGNAGNGKSALFGSVDGVLAVNEDGSQKLIKYPASFQAAWLSSILEAKGANVFVGYSAAIGAYLINETAGTITPIIESADIAQVKIDYAGKNLVALLHSGEVRIYDLATNKLTVSAKVVDAIDKASTQKPQLEATAKFVYVTLPQSGELLRARVSDLTKTERLKVSATPYRLALLGIESDESH